MFAIRGQINLGLNFMVQRESLVLYSSLFQKRSSLSSLIRAASVIPPLKCNTFVNLRSYGAPIPSIETVRLSNNNFQLAQRLNVFASHSVLSNWICRRWMGRSAPIELQTDNDVVRFSFSKQHDKNGSLEKGKKTTKRGKMSRKAKLNELRFYRLKAKKKMNSPNPEVRIRYKLEKAKRKEAWLIEKLRKFEIPKIPAEVYDPEILTEEEKHYLKRTGEKKKNFILVGRRGAFGGVVLNMHLHWKKHETVKVICRPCKPGQIHEYAEVLAQLSKGIVIDVKPNNSIIFYRGKNYVRPDVLSPPNTLSKQKALEKYKYEQSLEHTSQFIEKLEKELQEYLEHVARYGKVKEDTPETAIVAA